MAQIRNKYDINSIIEDEDFKSSKTLPRFFNENDSLNPYFGISYSFAVHIAIIIFLFILNFFIPHLPKPELTNKDIEFKLVQNESKPPINKNTKIRSDRDSQAGGKHNPKQKISTPSTPAAKPKKEVKPAVSQPQTNKTQHTKKPLFNKPVTKSQPAVAQNPSPVKPSAVKAPAAIKPSVKPLGSNNPSMPKIASAPKPPFSVPVPKGQAPSGTAYRPAGQPTSTGNTKPSTGTGNSMPQPQFSSQRGSSGSSGSAGSPGSSGSKYASRGSSGSGGGPGNPGPGNPNGVPGIDAIKEPNWGPYMRDLEQRIKRNWSPPKGDSSKRVVITFTISRDGRLLNHKITKSSGVPLADRAALSAIEATAPFRPLPPEFKGQSVPIEFTFDYNVLNSVLR